MNISILNDANLSCILFAILGLLVLGNLPAGTLGLGRNDEEQNFNHRAGSLGRPPHDVLLPPPRLPAPANPISNGINRFKKGIKRIVGRVSSQMHQMYSIAGLS